MSTIELSDTDRELLRIFGQQWAFSGPKETAIREATGLRSFEAAQRVNRLLETEVALAEFPTVVNRLRRVRAANKR